MNIIKLAAENIPTIVDAFSKSNWTEKPASLFEQYLKEQVAGERVVWLAFIDNDFAGYITLKWNSSYEPFRANNIPEIVDLNVLPQFRKRGIGTALLNQAEQAAWEKTDTIGIGVGLYVGEDGGYGAAQQLYVKHAYIPDGKGITYNYKPVTPGESYPVDDDLILWFKKNRDV